VTAWPQGIAILGVGETPFGPHGEESALQLHARSALLAVEDAGVELHEVDGLLTAGSRTDGFLMHSAAVAEYLGIEPRLSASLSLGGANHCASVTYAVAAISAGLASKVLIVAADSLITSVGRAGAVDNLTRSGAGDPDFENPHGATLPALYALAAKRHMHEYGTTPEQLAAVAVAMRRYATANPNAHMRDEVTVEDVLNSRLIAEPLHLLDCCPVSNGGGALLIGRAAPGTDAVRVIGSGSAVAGEHVSQLTELTTTAARVSAKAAYETANVQPKDIDLAYLYDSFTIAVLLQLEDLGFCERGEAGRFVEDGNLAIGGSLPTNTHGGLLSHGHPGRAGGIVHLVEAVRQLRASTRTAVVHGMGGAFGTHATVVLAR
jgi:acetyl-CoA acetyltransferase